MSKHFKIFIFVGILLCQMPLCATFLFVEEDLHEMQKEFLHKNPFFQSAAADLIQTADSALAGKPVSVMDKTGIPPSNSKHDYMSLATYWWPDPAAKNGVPYIRKDGVINPDTKSGQYDLYALNKMSDDCIHLCWAYFLTREEKYALEAIRKIKTWFLDPMTAMNPNLNYAQGIPGKTSGRPEGIIDASSFPGLFDSISLLRISPNWTPKIDQALKDWASLYLNWLLNSPNGIKESSSKNNHATWYDYQAVFFALYTNQRDLAQNHLKEYTLPKLKSHFTEEGLQPLELKRTRPFHYSTFNLTGLYACARLGEWVDVDFWECDSDKSILRNALDWLLPFVKGEKEWIYKDLEPLNFKKIAPLLLMAARAYKDPSYTELYFVLMDQESPKDKYNLFYPRAFLKFEKDRQSW